MSDDINKYSLGSQVSEDEQYSQASVNDSEPNLTNLSHDQSLHLKVYDIARMATGDDANHIQRVEESSHPKVENPSCP